MPYEFKELCPYATSSVARSMCTNEPGTESTDAIQKCAMRVSRGVWKRGPVISWNAKRVTSGTVYPGNTPP